MSSGPELLDTAAPRRPRRGGLALALVLLLVLALGAWLSVHTPSAESPATSPPSLPGPGSSAPTVLRALGPGLPGFSEGDLFLRSTDAVLRLELATGRLTSTPARLPVGEETAVLAGPAGVVLRPLADGPGLLVPDGRPAVPLRGRLSEGAQVLPGPPGRLWVSESYDGQASTLALTRFDGTATGPLVREAGYFVPNGAGDLLLVTTSGVFERRSGWHRLSPGAVLATGARHLLLTPCAEVRPCALELWDRRSRTRQELPPPDVELSGGGVLSPDGRWLATLRAGSDAAGGPGVLQVLDLRTGRVVHESVVAAGAGDVGGIARWSASGRRLLTLDEGRLLVLEPATGRTARPDLGLPELLALTWRAAG